MLLHATASKNSVYYIYQNVLLNFRQNFTIEQKDNLKSLTFQVSFKLTLKKLSLVGTKKVDSVQTKTAKTGYLTSCL